MRNQMVTENLEDFGSRERALLRDLLTAWNEQGLPEDFYSEKVRPAFNINSGYVFLTNEECQVAMLNGDKLENWYNCFNCGHEGFKERITDDGKNCNKCGQTLF